MAIPFQYTPPTATPKGSALAPVTGGAIPFKYTPGLTVPAPKTPAVPVASTLPVNKAVGINKITGMNIDTRVNPFSFGNPIQDIKDAGNALYSAVATPNLPLAQRFNQGVSALAGAPMNVAADLIPGGKPALNAMGSVIGGAVNATGNAIGSIPAVQQAVIQHPVIANTIEGAANVGVGLGNVANTALMGVGIAKGIPKAIDATKSAIDNVKNAPQAPIPPSGLASIENSKAGAVDTFNKNLNKALPVLKKDVQNLPTKQADARTALTDIVANKDKIGILDKNGEIKSPSKYDFVETADANATRLKQVYADYSAKLSTVDKTKFEGDIKSSIDTQKSSIADQLSKENSIDGRRALTKINAELSTLRDTSPEGIQSYIESIGQRTKTAPGHPPTAEQIKLANIGGAMKTALDNSIDKIDGVGYKDIRGVYKAHKTIQSQLLQAAKSQLNKTPGWTDRMANLGLTAEGINFILTHDPHALMIGAGIKGSTMIMKYLRSPQRALSNMFSSIEKGQMPPRIPSAINQTAMSTPMANNIPTTLPQSTPKVKLPPNKK